MVNRATKRLMAKQQRAEGRAGGARAASAEEGGRRPAVRLEKKERTPPRQFLREVRGELKKVAWPSRREVGTYTVVVLVSVLFITGVVFALDYGMNEAVFSLFTK